MSAYTLTTLSDADFEDLVRDLLSAELGYALQPFTKGRDLGIDLLHGPRLVGATIVQCKHYCRSSFSALRSKLATDERAKIDRLAPKRYILATSLGLTPPNKQALVDALSPHCLGLNDVYGLDDINALLRKYPQIESAHYKLWMTSAPVLQRMLRQGAAVWNVLTKEDLERKMALYVRTDAYDVALDTLARRNYCIISGIPGIGKTTLAQVLVTRLMDTGFELISVREDVREAFESLDLSRKQVVYYDDFLGQSSLSDRLGKNEDSGLLRLLNQAARAKHLKVILTTREYILEEAKQVYEPLNNPALELGKYIVELEQYTRAHRARILYNHLYVSGLPTEYASAMVKSRGYRSIIDHKNYSPRIIEWMTLGAGFRGVAPEAYVDRFVAVLDDPAELWGHAFDNQIGDDARAILFCLGSVEGWCGLTELKSLWERVRGRQTDQGQALESKRAFHAAMKQLDGSFTATMRAHSDIVVRFHNPSIKDYVRRRTVEDADVLMLLLRSSAYFEQVHCLVRLSHDGRVGPVPSGVVPYDAMLREALSRTWQANAATYQAVHLRSGGEILTRDWRDIGRRMSWLSVWAEQSGYEDLLPFCCELVAQAVAAGDVARVATVGCCNFLDAVLRRYPGGDYTESILTPLIVQIDKDLTDEPLPTNWVEWTRFVQRNVERFSQEDLTHWTERAEAVCLEEIDEIVHVTSSSEAQSRFDDLESIAQGWDLPLDEIKQRFEEHMEEVYAAEDGRDYDDDDWRSFRSDVQAAGADDHIDRLFDSLRDRL